MDDLPAVLRGEVAGLAAQQRRHLSGVVGRQPTRDDDAVGSDELDRVVGEEVTGDAGDPAASSEACRSRTAATAPASSTSRPRGRVAKRSQNCRVRGRGLMTVKNVPT